MTAALCTFARRSVCLFSWTVSPSWLLGERESQTRVSRPSECAGVHVWGGADDAVSPVVHVRLADTEGDPRSQEATLQVLRLDANMLHSTWQAGCLL